jgi:hypothetical protein
MHQNQPSGRPKALRRADFDSLPDRIKPKSSPEWQVPARKFLLCAILHVQITATIKHGPHNMFPINQTPRQQVHRPCPPRTPRSLTADGGEECTMAKPLRPPAPRIDSTTGAYPRDRSRVQESFHSKVRKCIASHRDGKPSKTPVGLALPRTPNFISDYCNRMLAKSWASDTVAADFPLTRPCLECSTWCFPTGWLEGRGATHKLTQRWLPKFTWCVS